ncbi:hypothetical protein CASFOL_037806 [Castilleja foliolosa]|uniref:Protein kinase domain-containing protein n=1 Tax=Castilleja foliolosa TaxID=1961234 RepID=A0ABD3BL69_9LAMI
MIGNVRVDDSVLEVLTGSCNWVVLGLNGVTEVVGVARRFGGGQMVSNYEIDFGSRWVTALAEGDGFRHGGGSGSDQGFSMLKTLERYQKCNYGAPKPNISAREALEKGSLEENLHGNKNKPLEFGWNERYRVAIGVAEALEYLHNRDDQPVIHRDVKSSNILLSDDFEPQLSDFGLAKWATTGSSHITYIDVAGTFGYMAPEYFMYGKANEKIDVYAYGVERENRCGTEVSTFLKT